MGGAPETSALASRGASLTGSAIPLATRSERSSQSWWSDGAPCVRPAAGEPRRARARTRAGSCGRTGARANPEAG
eukprot:scaffold71608_cov63-Phaeocystis_antarctica.AAC.3